jgi:hypothetical protein
MSAPDAALLWARSFIGPAWHTVSEHTIWMLCEAFRAGQAHDTGLLAALEKIATETADVTKDLDNYGMCIAAVNAHARAAIAAAIRAQGDDQ